MANAEQVELLLQGSEVWNAWRAKNRDVPVDLTQANLTGADLSGARLEYAALGGAILRKANLGSAQMPEAWLVEADLREANLHYVNLRGACLYKANLTKADLTKASLFEADLRYATLTKADLAGALLEHSRLIGTNLQGANLDGCGVYGISAWDLQLNSRTKQVDLIITPQGQPAITVDNLKVAQFIYLILNNAEIRDVIGTITSKAVLILGRFSPPARKFVLESVREALRVRGYAPIVFDFAPSKSRDLTETIQVLASMARFVIADLSGARSIPQELSHIVPHLPSVPVQPILLASKVAYSMFEHWRRYPWVLREVSYKDSAHLLSRFDNDVIAPVETRLKEGAAPGTLDDAMREIALLKAQLAGRGKKKMK
jgi:uncharacterized protein YjbI with pentapeptide repeats